MTKILNKPQGVNLENSLARFKKRKWGSEKPRKTESEAPPTEPEAPPAETFEDKSATKKLTDRLFWMRIVFSVVGGIIATFAFEDIVDVLVAARPNVPLWMLMP